MSNGASYNNNIQFPWKGARGPVYEPLNPLEGSTIHKCSMCDKEVDCSKTRSLRLEIREMLPHEPSDYGRYPYSRSKAIVLHLCFECVEKHMGTVYATFWCKREAVPPVDDSAYAWGSGMNATYAQASMGAQLTQAEYDALYNQAMDQQQRQAYVSAIFAKQSMTSASGMPSSIPSKKLPEVKKESLWQKMKKILYK